jgi:hypothetical protein
LRDRNQIGTSNRRGAFAERALIRRSRRRLLLVFGGECANRIRKAHQNKRAPKCVSMKFVHMNFLYETFRSNVG